MIGQFFSVDALSQEKSKISVLFFEKLTSYTKTLRLCLVGPSRAEFYFSVSNEMKDSLGTNYDMFVLCFSSLPIWGEIYSEYKINEPHVRITRPRTNGKHDKKLIK